MKNKYQRIVPYSFIALLALMLCLVFVGRLQGGQNYALTMMGSSHDFSNAWYTLDSDGKKQSVNLANLNPQRQIGKGNTISLYHKAPKGYGVNEDTVALYVKHLNFKVFLNDTLIYTSHTERGLIRSKTSSVAWYFIPMPDSNNPDDVLRIDATVVYNSGNEAISSAYYGNSAVMSRTIISDETGLMIFCMALLVIGLLYIVLDIVLTIAMKYSIGMKCTGTMAIMIAIWAFSQSQVLSFFMQNTIIANFTELMVLQFVPIPLLEFCDHHMRMKNKRVVHLGYIVSIANIVIQLLLYFIVKCDYHEMRPLTHITVLVCGTIYLYCSAENMRLNVANPRLKLIGKLTQAGMIIFCAFTATDIIKFYLAHEINSGMNTLCGFSVFLLMMGVIGVIDLMDYSKRVYVSDLIRQNAYTDTLTGMKNRNSFEKHMENAENEKKKYKTVAVVVFDVNNLKQVNDNYGHQEGDYIISSCGHLIENNFKAIAENFRIGGDEFAAIITGDLPTMDVYAQVDNFRNDVNSHNEGEPAHLQLHVAVGIAFMDMERRQTMTDVFRKADILMYNNKKTMKKVQAKGVM